MYHFIQNEEDWTKQTNGSHCSFKSTLILYNHTVINVVEELEKWNVAWIL